MNPLCNSSELLGWSSCLSCESIRIQVPGFVLERLLPCWVCLTCNPGIFFRHIGLQIPIYKIFALSQEKFKVSCSPPPHPQHVQTQRLPVESGVPDFGSCLLLEKTLCHIQLPPAWVLGSACSQLSFLIYGAHPTSLFEPLGTLEP